jgi:phosphoenolpyruvate synthase/pyruvate phosphate dikinase
MAVVEQPTEQPITDKTRAILQAINELDSKLNELQNVSEAVREIKEQLNTGSTWRTAIIRALNQFLSHVDPNWKKNHQ